MLVILAALFGFAERLGLGPRRAREVPLSSETGIRAALELLERILEPPEETRKAAEKTKNQGRER
jgi:hypothetical protein